MKRLLNFDEDDYYEKWAACLLDKEKDFYHIRKMTTIAFNKYLDNDLHSFVRDETVTNRMMFIPSRISNIIDRKI